MYSSKKYFVFVDVDGTLLRIKTMFSFLQFLYKTKNPWLGRFKFYSYAAMTKNYEKLGVSREWLNQRYYRQFKGRSQSAVMELGQVWFQQTIKPSHYVSSVLQTVKNHQRKGGEVVFVSGSFDPCLIPLAKTLQVRHILATQLEINAGCYTGKIKVPMIGESKAVAIRIFLQQHSIASRHCFAYADHSSDLEMLKTVGNPSIVAGDKQLEQWATRLQWPVLPLS